jgi:glucose-1-phosphate cytidylyltransferase
MVDKMIEAPLPVGLLTGGLGTRLSEETTTRPKPMVEIGGMPILWHIMKHYSSYGCQEFFLALGYKGEMIKDFFVNYRHRMTDFSVDLRSGNLDFASPGLEDWRVHLMDTGQLTQTGGRAKHLLQRAGRTMYLTYGDGVSDINLARLLAFHRHQGKLATVTAVRPPARFGELRIKDGLGLVSHFEEKPQVGEGWINGGFFVFEPEVAEFIAGDDTLLERAPMERLVAEEQLAVYQHEGFWQCMDTLRDVRVLEDLWQKGKAPWAADTL